jgi:hypothetical protein
MPRTAHEQEELEVTLVDERAPGLAVREATALPSIHDQQRAKLKDIEDQLLVSSLSIVRDALAFEEIDPNTTEPPEHWVQELGPEGAEKRFRMAQAAWLNAKEAPVGLKLAKELGLGIIKARSTESAGARLNVAVQAVVMPAQYAVKSVDE